MESAIETSKNIDKVFLCNLWNNRTPYEMADCLHGFYLLDCSHDWAMRDEVRFLNDLCWTKHHMKRDELKEAA